MLVLFENFEDFFNGERLIHNGLTVPYPIQFAFFVGQKPCKTFDSRLGHYLRHYLVVVDEVG
jgi:hypothetical protein